VRRAAVIVLTLVAVIAAGATKKRPLYDSNLPVLGTKFHSLPAGAGKQLVEASCFPCHSADMLVQQRLSDKQWTTEVDKMIRWGAVVKDSDKAAMIAYLSKSFGPANKFTPVRTRPVGY
jgi:cytochrome c1